MKTPHKHAELIKAWADGALIECLVQPSNTWELRVQPTWSIDATYRIKPEPKHDVATYFRTGNISREMVSLGASVGVINTDRQRANLKLTFDGETGKLKSAEVIG